MCAIIFGFGQNKFKTVFLWLPFNSKIPEKTDMVGENSFPDTVNVLHKHACKFSMLASYENSLYFIL